MVGGPATLILVEEEEEEMVITIKDKNVTIFEFRDFLYEVDNFMGWEARRYLEEEVERRDAEAEEKYQVACFEVLDEVDEKLKQIEKDLNDIEPDMKKVSTGIADIRKRIHKELYQ